MADEPRGPASPVAETGQDERVAEAPVKDESKTPAKTEAQDKSGTKPNWYDDPEFRKMQSNFSKAQEEYKRNQAELQAALEQERRARQALEERGLDDYGKLQLRLQREAEARQKAEKKASEYQEYLEGLEVRRQRLDDVAKKYDIPRHELESIWNPEEITDFVINYRIKAAEKERAAREEEEDEKRRQANLPDLGGGRSSPPSPAVDAARRALDKRDSVALVKAAWLGK